VDVLGLRTHVREAGAGETIVLVHGLGVSGRYFGPLGEVLACSRRVLVPDLPGWGRSESPPRPLGVGGAADVLAELVRLEGVGTVPLVANSFGCQVVCALAHRRPELVGPLVLIGPTVDAGYRSWVRHAGRLVLDSSREPRAMLPILLGDYARVGVRRLIATARSALADDLEERLPLVEQPVLVLRGERDAITTLAWARRCAELAPRGRFEPIAKAAHLPHFSHPGSTARLVEAFLAEGGDRLR